MAQQSNPLSGGGSGDDRPVTWRDLTVYGHGVLTTAALHLQTGWPTSTSTAVGMTGPVLWELLRRRR